jgi:hypothetical protein
LIARKQYLRKALQIHNLLEFSKTASPDMTASPDITAPPGISLILYNHLYSVSVSVSHFFSLRLGCVMLETIGIG